VRLDVPGCHSSSSAALTINRWEIGAQIVASAVSANPSLTFLHPFVCLRLPKAQRSSTKVA
jgi:hypothetical protein